MKHKNQTKIKRIKHKNKALQYNDKATFLSDKTCAKSIKKTSKHGISRPRKNL